MMNIQKTAVVHGLSNKKSAKKTKTKGDIFAQIFENMKKNSAQLKDKSATKKVRAHIQENTEKPSNTSHKSPVIEQGLFFNPSVEKLPVFSSGKIKSQPVFKETGKDCKISSIEEFPFRGFINEEPATSKTGYIQSFLSTEKTGTAVFPAQNTLPEKKVKTPYIQAETSHGNLAEGAGSNGKKRVQNQNRTIDVISTGTEKNRKENNPPAKKVNLSSVFLGEKSEKTVFPSKIIFPEDSSFTKIGDKKQITGLIWGEKSESRKTAEMPTYIRKKWTGTAKEESRIIFNTVQKTDIEKAGKSRREELPIEIKKGVKILHKPPAGKSMKEPVSAPVLAKIGSDRQIEPKDVHKTALTQEHFARFVEGSKAFYTSPPTGEKVGFENTENKRGKITIRAGTVYSKKTKNKPEIQTHKTEVKQNRENQINRQGYDVVEHISFSIPTTERLHQNRTEPGNDVNTGLKLENPNPHIAYMHQEGSGSNSEQNHSGTHHEYSPDGWDNNMENHNESNFQKNLTLNLKLDGISLKARYNGMRLNLSIMMKDIAELNFSQLSGDITQIIQESGIDNYFLRIRDKEREYRMYSQTKKTVQTASSREINVKV